MKFFRGLPHATVSAQRHSPRNGRNIQELWLWGMKSSVGKLAVMLALHRVIMMVSYVPGLWKTWRFHVYTNVEKTVQLCANIWT